MRKQLLGIFLPLLAMVLMAAAETQSTGMNETGHASLQKVNVVLGDDGITLEVIARGQLTPKLETLEAPARLVINLPNTSMATSVNHIDVGGDGVKGVRIGTDNQATPTTRIVVDLLHKCRYEVVPGIEGKLTVKLHSGTAVAKAVAPVKAAPRVQSADTLAATAVSEVKETHTATLPAAISVSEKANTATASASNFVFVEPSYKPKQPTEDSFPAVAANRAPDASACAQRLDTDVRKFDSNERSILG